MSIFPLYQPSAYQPPSTPGPVRAVSNAPELAAAIAALNGVGGRIDLAPGDYGSWPGVLLRATGGGPDRPLIFHSVDRHAARFTRSGAGLVIKLMGCEDLVFHGLTFQAQAGAVWTFVAGWNNPYEGDPEPCRRITVSHCLIDGARCSQAVFTVNGSSTDWSIVDNRIIGGAAESIYLGGSPDYNDRGSKFLIRGNEILGGPQSRGVGGGEAIDVKPLVQDVTIEDNLIHDHVVSHSGVIVAAQNDKPGNAYAEGRTNIVIRRNRIWNVRRSNEVAGGAPYHGASVINPNSEGTDVVDNIVWNASIPAISVSGMTGNGRLSEEPCRITGNVTWATAGSVTYGGYGGTATRCVVTGNVLHQAPGGGFPAGSTVADNTVDASGARFVGPLTGVADAGQGPGSGFAVKGSTPPPPPPPAPEPTPEPEPEPTPEPVESWSDYAELLDRVAAVEAQLATPPEDAELSDRVAALDARLDTIEAELALLRAELTRWAASLRA